MIFSILLTKKVLTDSMIMTKRVSSTIMTKHYVYSYIEFTLDWKINSISTYQNQNEWLLSSFEDNKNYYLLKTVKIGCMKAFTRLIQWKISNL